MKIKIYQFLALVVLISLSYSCKDDFFKEQAGNRITPDEHYNSQNDLYNNSMYGTYVPLQKALPKLLLVDGLRSDMIDTTYNSDIFMKEINDQNISMNNPYIDGSDYYKVIINVNEILPYVDKVFKLDPTSVSYQKKFTIGALITIRAGCYFTLVKMFGQAALISDNMASVHTNKVLQKAEMIDLLIDSLKPYVFNDPKHYELGFMGPNTKALIGELYLENAYLHPSTYYDSAAYYLKLGMESYGNTKDYKVTTLYAIEAWKTIFYQDGPILGAECIDGVYYDSRRNQYNDFAGWALSNNYLIKPSQLLVDSFNAQISTAIGTGDVYRGKHFTFDTLPNSNTAYYISKYNLNNDPYGSYIITSRAADIHLLLAEALLHKFGGPDTSTALLLLNDGIKSADVTPDGYDKWSDNVGVRGRVSLEPRTIPANLTGTDAINAIEDQIIDERALELAFEGKRWFDLVRVAMRRNNPDYLARKVALKYGNPDVSGSRAESIRNKLKLGNWYLPIK